MISPICRTRIDSYAINFIYSRKTSYIRLQVVNSIEFKDTEVFPLSLKSSKDLSRLIVEYLCGEDYNPRLFKKVENLLMDFIHNLKERQLNYRQFNELLLLLDQDKVGRDFFNFFFEKDRVSFNELKEGITKFRGFAMLCFGNFRFAYKQLIQMDEKKLIKKLSPYYRKPEDVEREYHKRPKKVLDIQKIPRDQTWRLGIISGKLAEKDVEELAKEKERFEKGRSSFTEKELAGIEEELAKMGTQIQRAQAQAFRNTEVYLTWDYMDIYVATSMRNKWEYEETFDFMKKVFDDTRLQQLNIRYFDPTQSKCHNSREKGLVEGLMLKTSSCTIYLAQESDTMGKDSELAATLAQSKPVIAYVPKHEPEEYARKIHEYPLDFFKKRLLILDAEGIFEDRNCVQRLREYDPGFGKTIDEFLDAFRQHRSTEHFFILRPQREKEFRKEYENFSKICMILAIAECHNFEFRAKLLRELHPLSMQVDLQSGVANGVLVVRSPKECAEALYKILTNRMKFEIFHHKPKNAKKEEGYTVLKEEISQSPFRVVIDNRKLTNSFWNLFTYPS